MTRITATLHEDPNTFWTHFTQIFLERNIFQTKLVKKIKPQILLSIFCVCENRAIYEIMWKNTAASDRPRTTIWLTRIACRETKATNTHSEYVILVAFPLQQWLNERAWILRCTYIDWLVILVSCCTQHGRRSQRRQRTHAKTFICIFVLWPTNAHNYFTNCHAAIYFLTFCWPCCISVYLSQ